MAFETSTKKSPKSTPFPRKLHTYLGFSSGSRASQWLILSGPMIAFCLARIPYLAINTFYRTHAAPGEWFYFRQPLYRTALAIHLLSVIPAGLLATLQFTPLVRSKAPWLHRTIGYAIILLVTLANISGLILARRAFGGTVETQLFVGVLAIATSACMLLACVEIRRGRVAEHRAWMLRCWSYLGTPLTIRLLVPILALTLSLANEPYYTAVSCEQIAFVGLEFGDDNHTAADAYATCREDPAGWTAVKANLFDPASVTEVMAGLQVGFGAAGMLALIVHAVVVEVFLGVSKLTAAGGSRIGVEEGKRQSGRLVEGGD